MLPAIWATRRGVRSGYGEEVHLVAGLPYLLGLHAASGVLGGGRRVSQGVGVIGQGFWLTPETHTL